MINKNMKNKIVIITALCVLALAACSNAGTIDRSSGHSDNQIQNRNTDTGHYSGDADVSAAEHENTAGEYITLSEASTRILDKSPNRIHNIRLATDSLKNIVIESGKEFSFNTVVGERSMERGYKEAAAILYEDRVSEVGGGVCQISTTIYQAAKNAGLEIVERNQHNKKVDYTDEGTDACVEYGRLDLRFKNNSDKAIILKASTDGEYVYASIESNS